MPVVLPDGWLSSQGGPVRESHPYINIHGATVLTAHVPSQDLVLDVSHINVEASKNALNIPKRGERSGENYLPCATRPPAFQLQDVSTTLGIHHQGQLCSANLLLALL